MYKLLFTKVRKQDNLYFLRLILELVLLQEIREIMKTLLVIIGLLVGGNVFGQDEWKDEYYNYNSFPKAIKSGHLNYILGYKNLNTLELGIARGERGEGFGEYTYSNIHFSPEITFNSDKVIWGNKFGVTTTFYWATFTCQFIHYTDFKNQNLVIRPEIGPSLCGIAELVYG
ncbi:MAG: hypothetical protein RLZZ175_1729 [Bacteroidota bacterium]|jgi:hypothetical protein